MHYIIGAGAIGKALAVFLDNCGHEVTLVRGSVDFLPAVTEDIRVQLPDGTELTASVPVQTFSGLGKLDGPVLVTAKSYGNPFISTKLDPTSPYPVVLLQNGLNVEQSFTSGGFRQLYRCVLMVTSQFTDSNTIRFKPVSSCPVGIVSGTESELTALVSKLENPWFPFRAELDIQPLIWKKVIVNCIFNSVCPLLEIDNGIFERDSRALEIAERMIGECLSVARRCGVVLELKEIKAMLLDISRSSAGQFISTLQDIRNGRPTEIGTLNQEVASLARGFGIAHLVRQTQILGELTEIKSNL